MGRKIIRANKSRCFTQIPEFSGPESNLSFSLIGGIQHEHIRGFAEGLASVLISRRAEEDRPSSIVPVGDRYVLLLTFSLCSFSRVRYSYREQLCHFCFKKCANFHRKCRENTGGLILKWGFQIGRIIFFAGRRDGKKT